MWNWIHKNLAALFTPISKRLERIELAVEVMSATIDSNTYELKQLRKKVVRPSERFEQVERKRSRSRHPARHH